MLILRAEDHLNYSFHYYFAPAAHLHAYLTHTILIWSSVVFRHTSARVGARCISGGGVTRMRVVVRPLELRTIDGAGR